uniref:BEACH domain-containing protein n=1 Tax=Macrostomum lignano TaxID=282301 RepID=A0A1I8FKS0_9PLAT
MFLWCCDTSEFNGCRLELRRRAGSQPAGHSTKSRRCTFAATSSATTPSMRFFWRQRCVRLLAAGVSVASRSDEVARVVDGLELDSRVRKPAQQLTRPSATVRSGHPGRLSAVARHRDKYEVLDRQYRELGPDHDHAALITIRVTIRTPGHRAALLGPPAALHPAGSPCTAGPALSTCPDRTFHSIPNQLALELEAVGLGRQGAHSGVLLPAGVFYHSEELDFGVKQSGVRVDNVELPPWAADDPRRFVLIHRAALESPLVTEKLHKWIDLIFGYKQTGKAALSSVNLFHPYTYFGAIDLDQIDDPVRRRAIETMIKTYGQTPKQLFRSPHQPPVAAAPRSGRVPGAFGVRFGNYCGSPDCQAPPQVRCRDGPAGAGLLPVCEQLAAPVAQLVLNPSPVGPSAPEVLGLCPGTCALAGGQLLVGAADNVFRWRPAPTSASASAGAGQALGAPPPDWLGDRVTAAAACGWRVFCGLRSGLLRVFSVAASSTRLRRARLVLRVRGPRPGRRPDRLARRGARAAARPPVGGHRGARLPGSLRCSPLATGRRAAACCCGLRALLRPSGPPVAALTASPTLADVAVLGQGQGSQLTVYTANGALVGSVSSGGGGGGGDRITCAVYSSLPEGRFINCLAVGLSSGCVRLLNSWDLGDLAFIRPGLASPARGSWRSPSRATVAVCTRRIGTIGLCAGGAGRPYLSGGGGSGGGGGGGGGGMGQKTSKQQFAAFL